MNTKKTTAVLAALVMAPAALSGCSVLGASSNETTPSDSTVTIAPYSADEAAATAKAMEADAYAQGEEAYKRILELDPRSSKPSPEEMSAYATQRYIDESNDFAAETFSGGRYFEGDVKVESVEPVSYVAHGNPGWRMRMRFCVNAENTMYEKDGSLSDFQFTTPDGTPLAPGEATSNVVTVDYTHSNGIWRANAEDYEAAESC